MEVVVGHYPLILIILSYFLLADFLMMLFQVEVVVPTNHPNLAGDLEALNYLIQMVHFLALEVELDLELLQEVDQVVVVLLAEEGRNSMVPYSMKMT